VGWKSIAVDNLAETYVVHPGCYAARGFLVFLDFLCLSYLSYIALTGTFRDVTCFYSVT